MDLLSPLDTRYASQTRKIATIMGDKAYCIMRMNVELAYLKILLEMREIRCEELDKLLDNMKDKKFTDELYIKYNKYEEITNHDVKAIEYTIGDYIKRIITVNDIEYNIKNLVHCGITSQDINSVSTTIMLNQGIKYIYDLYISKKQILEDFYNRTDIVSMTYTHGQPAIPSKMNIEMKKLFIRVDNAIEELTNEKITCKFSSANGNSSTLSLIYDDKIITKERLDKLYDDILKNLHKLCSYDSSNISFTYHARQIDDYTSYIKILNNIQLIGTAMDQVSHNLWLQTSRGELQQIKKENECGSSVMPHKTNPCKLEQVNSINKILYHMCEGIKLSICVSRDSRDISDSFALRHYGCVFGYLAVLINSLFDGIIRLCPNEQYITHTLYNYSCIAEYIQTFLRLNYSYDDEPYKVLERFTKGKEINKEMMHTFIDSLTIIEDDKQFLKSISPNTYPMFCFFE